MPQPKSLCRFGYASLGLELQSCYEVTPGVTAVSIWWEASLPGFAVMSEVLEGWVAVHDPLPKRRLNSLVQRPNGLFIGDKGLLAAAIKHSCAM